LEESYREEMGTEMFQRQQLCQNVARKIASKNNNNYIKESSKYFNSKVKPEEFTEKDRLLMKKTQFLNKI
jgi:hypothetical protein